MALTASDTAAPEWGDHESGLSDTDKMSGVQPSYAHQHRLPRKKDKELNAEVVVEVQPGYIDQERLPRKEEGNGELEAETLRSNVHCERLPRKKNENMVAAQAELVQSTQ